MADLSETVAVGEDAPVFEVMSTMRAMRRLKPDPVPDELLEKLVAAATWGPSGSNLQGYEFVVVTERAVMGRLAPLWSPEEPCGRRHDAAVDLGPVSRRPAAEVLHRDRW